MTEGGVGGAAAFALLDCVPYMAIVMVMFRDVLRVRRGVAVAVCVGLAVLEAMIGSWRCGRLDDNLTMAALAVALPALWGFPMMALIRVPWRQSLFVLLIFINLSGTVMIIGNALGAVLLPAGAGVPYTAGWLLMVAVALVAMLGGLHALCGRLFFEVCRGRGDDDIWRYFWLIPSLFAVSALEDRFDTATPEYVAVAEPKTFLFLMVMFCTKLVVYYVIFRLVRTHRQKTELQGINRQLQLHEQAYRSYRDRDLAERRIRHDFRHQLAVIAVMAEEGRYDELCEFVGRTGRAIADATPERLAADPGLDALLHYHRQEARRRGVRFDLHVGVMPERYYDANDLILIFGNLLDNAIIAAGACRDAAAGDVNADAAAGDAADVDAGEHGGRAYVDLRVGQINDSVVILVRNSYRGRIDRHGGRFRSTRHDGDAIGISSVEQVVARIGGVSSFTYDERTFTAHVTLPAHPGGRRGVQPSRAASQS